MTPPRFPLRVGLVGAGAMGSLHARVVAQSTDAELVCVVDPDAHAGETLAQRWGSRWTADLDSFAGIDALIVASPTHTHVDWATRAITSGTPVLVEKPIADDLASVERVLELARASDVPITCGFLERFNAALRTALEIVEDPRYVLATRHSHHQARIATGVAYDLLIHDVDVVLRMAGELPATLSAHFGFAHPSSVLGAEDIAEATLRFEGGLIATLSANRISQRKVRTLVVNELDRLVEVDLVREDVTVYRHVQGDWLAGRDGGVSQQTVIDIPFVHNMREPLAGQLDHFLRLASGRADADDERATLWAPHAVVARIAERAGRDAIVV